MAVGESSGKGSRIALLDRENEDQRSYTSSASIRVPEHDNSTSERIPLSLSKPMLTIPIAPRERQHEHGVSLDIPNEQRQATTDLHTDIRRSEDHDGGKHEDQGAITGRPSEAAPERPHGGDQLGGDGKYPVGPGTYEGECWHTGNILSVNTSIPESLGGYDAWACRHPH